MKTPSPASYTMFRHQDQNLPRPDYCFPRFLHDSEDGGVPVEGSGAFLAAAESAKRRG